MMQRTWVGMAAFAVCVAPVASGCLVEERPPLRVQAIEVRGELDGAFDDLELEVHAFDAELGTFLGCAALVKADANNTRYAMKQAFVSSAGAAGAEEEDRELLRDADLVGRSLVLVVAEIDSNSGCPRVYDFNDEVVGVSPVISEESLMQGVSLSFDRVSLLSVGVER